MTSFFSSVSCVGISKDTAQKTYDALGKDQWKQWVDGCDHVYGPTVYDEGLHHPKREWSEPGYRESAEKTVQFVREHLCERPTVDFYKELHRTACQHFKGKLNNTNLTKEECGQFRLRQAVPVSSEMHITKLLYFYDREHLQCLNRIPEIKMYAVQKKPNGFNLGLSSERCVEFDALVEKGITSVRTYLDSLAKQEGALAHMAPTICLKEGYLHIDYSTMPFDSTLEEGIASLFKEFNDTMDDLNQKLQEIDPNEKEKVEVLQRKKFIAIANLYQKLEWLHPFQDGQGRTDRFLLDKLLTENGFCPALCFDPYVSSYTNLNDYCDYLEEGMANWKKCVFEDVKDPFPIPVQRVDEMQKIIDKFIGQLREELVNQFKFKGFKKQSI